MARGRKTGGRQRGTLNKATADVKAAAQVYSPEAVQVLAAIMRKGKSEQARIAAAKELLDRAHGKSTQHIETDVPPVPLFAIGTMPDVFPSIKEGRS